MAYRKAFMQYVCRGTAIPAEYRSDAISTTTDVGATIPTTVLNQIVEKLENTGMILALVTRTAYKGGVSIPVSTVKPTATWVNEGAGSDKQKKDITKDGMITFAYHKLRCAVAVSLEVDTMAISAFETLLITPTLLSNVARSLSGQQPMASKNATQERTYIKANGDVWEHTSWWEWNYIIALLKIMAKTEDLQEAYGNGNMSGYVNDSTKYYGVLASGSMDDKGQFYGYNAGNKQIKVFHTEAMWGDQWERMISQ